MTFTTHFGTLREAEAVALLLTERGIPETAIEVSTMNDPIVPVWRPQPGMDAAAPSGDRIADYFLTVKPGSDATRNEICKEILGSPR